MSVVPLTEAQLRAQVKTVRDKVPDARVIGVHAPTPWTGPASVQVDGEDMEVVFCPSTLAVRERLASRAPNDARLVVITDRTENDLGGDVLATLARRRLYRIDPWRVVLDLFRARELDPRIKRDRWLAEALLEAAPADGYSPVPSGVLDDDTVWVVLLERRLRLDDPQPDARALLRWTLSSDGLQGFETSPPELKDALAERLRSTSGPPGEGILRCVLAGHGRDALPIGLVCRVLFGPGADTEPRLREAAVRLEPLVGGQPPAGAAALGWADAAEAVVREIVAASRFKDVTPLLDRAEAILHEVRAEDFAYRSGSLVSGFDQRLVRFAGALSEFVVGGSTDVVLGAAAEAVLTHDYAPARSDRVETLQMAWRLARRARLDLPEPGSLIEAAYRYAAHGGFADWARARVWDGDPVHPVSEVYRGLSGRVAEMRERENRQFAALLGQWTTLGSASDAVVPVEDVLSRVVAPLAEHVPVLLLVVDGMSFAVFQELIGDLSHQGWMELGRGEPPVRRPAVAALPTVTDVSRTSLFCGAIRRGNSQVERDGFASHPALVAATRSGFPPVLFHKADLVEGAGGGPAAKVREEIAKPARRVVGAVINAVDDHLAKGDQLRLRWTTESIRPLRWLLDAARDAGRVVILTSDHGHVLDRDSVLRPFETDSLRCRPDDGAPAEGEIRLQGPRVLSPWGDRLIAPWSERVRYGMKQNGYHGGVTPQEVVIPLAVLTTVGLRIPDWLEIAPAVPEWWETREPTRPAEPSIKLAPAPAVTQSPVTRRAPQAELFPTPAGPTSAEPQPAAPPRPATSAPSWIDRLLASPTFESQRQLAARPQLEHERVRRFLLALDERGGKMTRPALARALGVPPFRLAGLITALRRLLNVDGYPVLSVDDASDTVELNRPLLETQFEV